MPTIKIPKDQQDFSNRITDYAQAKTESDKKAIADAINQGVQEILTKTPANERGQKLKDLINFQYVEDPRNPNSARATLASVLSEAGYEKTNQSITAILRTTPGYKSSKQAVSGGASRAEARKDTKYQDKP